MLSNFRVLKINKGVWVNLQDQAVNVLFLLTSTTLFEAAEAAEAPAPLVQEALTTGGFPESSHLASNTSGVVCRAAL